MRWQPFRDRFGSALICYYRGRPKTCGRRTPVFVTGRLQLELRGSRTDMQLHCLGTTGYHPSAQRHTACYFVPEAGLVLDAGTGIFRLPPLIETDSLDILLSHAHLDHVAGLTFFFDLLHQRPLDQIRIWGQREKLTAIREHLFHEALFPAVPPFQWHAIEETTPEIAGGGMLKWFPLSHPGGSVGYRIDWPGRSLSYVTDTVGDPAAEYVSVVRDSDLLLHECYFRDQHADWATKTGHTWTRRAAEVGKTAAARQLLLIHINPLETGDDPIGLAAARAVHPATSVAADGMVVDF